MTFDHIEKDHFRQVRKVGEATAALLSARVAELLGELKRFRPGVCRTFCGVWVVEGPDVLGKDGSALSLADYLDRLHAGVRYPAVPPTGEEVAAAMELVELLNFVIDRSEVPNLYVKPETK